MVKTLNIGLNINKAISIFVLIELDWVILSKNLDNLVNAIKLNLKWTSLALILQTDYKF